MCHCEAQRVGSRATTASCCLCLLACHGGSGFVSACLFLLYLNLCLLACHGGPGFVQQWVWICTTSLPWWAWVCWAPCAASVHLPAKQQRGGSRGQSIPRMEWGIASVAALAANQPRLWPRARACRHGFGVSYWIMCPVRGVLRARFKPFVNMSVTASPKCLRLRARTCARGTARPHFIPVPYGTGMFAWHGMAMPLQHSCVCITCLHSISLWGC